MRYTKNYKLKQPEADDYVLVEDFNENSDTVDDLIKKIESVIGDLENSEEKESSIKLIEKLQSNKADLGEDGKVVPEQLPEVDLSGIENSIGELEKNALKLGKSSTTALDGYRGMIAFNHAKSKHADPNAINKTQAKELFKENTNIVIIEDTGNTYPFTRIWVAKSNGFCILQAIISKKLGSTEYTLPVGYRPNVHIEAYAPNYTGRADYGPETIMISKNGILKISNSAILNIMYPCEEV